ncbi:MAG: sigma E protease regulator RseP [Bermanella sp.]
MSVIISILSLALTLAILVTVHEFGHYWVARRCGIKVLRFSVGFGKVLFSRTNKQGTEFAIAAIPLGGYVKMLDEREGEVAAELLDQTFNRKTVWQRMAVVIAGPLANILFAIFAYWLMFMVGVTQVKPIIGEVAANSVAAQAGLMSQQEITAVDGTRTASWQEVNYQLIKRLGDSGTLQIEVDNGSRHELVIERWLSDAEEPNPIHSLGFAPFRPTVPPILAELQAGMPAQQAGLLPDDVILAVDGQDIQHWLEFVKVVKAHAGQAISLSVQRQEKVLNIQLIPASRTAPSGETIGFAGAMVKAPALPQDFIRVQSFDPLTAGWRAIDKTWDMTTVTLQSIGKMIQGLLSVKNLSGPITIAKVASSQVQAGFEAFVGFLAYISIMLAVVNLLPIPVLDGGHLVFYVIEAVKGSPLSEKVQLMGMKLGMTLLLMVMVVAIFNDVSRL